MSAAAQLTSALGLALAAVVVLGSITSKTSARGRAPSRIARSDRPSDAHAARHARVRTASTALAAILLVAWLAGPLLCAAVIAAVTGVARGLPLLRQRHARRQQVRAIPEALDLVVVLLQAGATSRQACAQLGRRGPQPTQHAFTAVAHQLDRGQPFNSAIGTLRVELGEAITPFVELIAAAERHGLPTAHLVLQLSNETRSLRRRQDEAAARSLPVKLSFPLVTCTLPSFVLLAIAPAVVAALSSLGSNAW